MHYWEISPEQEQELHEIARDSVQRQLKHRGTAHLQIVLFSLEAWVFKSGRLCNTVDPRKRAEIAQQVLHQAEQEG
jgi:hypothetical protein